MAVPGSLDAVQVRPLDRAELEYLNPLGFRRVGAVFRRRQPTLALTAVSTARMVGVAARLTPAPLLYHGWRCPLCTTGRKFLPAPSLAAGRRPARAAITSRGHGHGAGLAGGKVRHVALGCLVCRHGHGAGCRGRRARRACQPGGWSPGRRCCAPGWQRLVLLAAGAGRGPRPHRWRCGPSWPGPPAGRRGAGGLSIRCRRLRGIPAAAFLISRGGRCR
jgi:hypothetical protein